MTYNEEDELGDFDTHGVYKAQGSLEKTPGVVGFAKGQVLLMEKNDR